MDIKYTCNGPRLSAEEVRGRLKARLAELKTQADKLPAQSEGRVPIMIKVVELAEQLDAANARDDASFVERAGCGYDLTEQIQAVPADGDVYEYLCPRCGNRGTMRRTSPEAQADAQ